MWEGSTQKQTLPRDWPRLRGVVLEGRCGHRCCLHSGHLNADYEDCANLPLRTEDGDDADSLYPMDDSPSKYWLGYSGNGAEWALADGRDADGHHADWPYYQGPPGELNALLDLCQYPHGTDLLIVDDIDQVLLLVVEPRRREIAHDLYAAAWHDDLKSLQDNGLIESEGLSWGSLDQWRHRRWMNARGEADGLFLEAADGTLVPIPEPVVEPRDPDDLFDDYETTWPLIREGATRIRVTEEGWARMEEFLRDALILGPDLSRISTLLELGFADTAVREATVTLESMLKRRLNTDKYGRDLVSLVNSRLEQAGTDPTYRRIVVTRLRTVYAFVRNKFAHNTDYRLPVSEANALCWRIASLYDSPVWDKV